MSRDIHELLMKHLRPLAELRVLVPSRDRYGRMLPVAQLKERIECLLLRIATGTINVVGEGVWQPEPGRLIREPILIIQGHVGNLVPDVKRAVIDDLVQFVADANQEALAVVINGRLFLLPGSPPSDQQSNPIEEC